MSVVPEPNNRLGQTALVPDNVHARGAQKKRHPVDRSLKPDPTCGQNANEVAARKNQYVVVYGTYASNYASARVRTCDGDSPPGQPSRNSCQSGRCARMSTERSPS